jgi:glycosyltransferase involved in cell wall biosynthesis
MGGLAKHVLALARALARAGHDVDFMGNTDHALDSGDPELTLPGRFYPELPGTQRGWRERRLGCFIPYKRDVIARGVARAILARAVDYDVVHYHGHYPNVGAFIPTAINFVQTRHDQGSDCLIHTRFRNGDVCTAVDPAVCAGCATSHPNGFQRVVSANTVQAYRRHVAESFRRHKTVFVSQMLLRNFTRSAGPGPWGSVVHNFIDKTALERAAASPIRPEDLPSNARLIVIAGKLYPPKGIDRLLGLAVPRLAGNMYILVMGDGPQEQSLRARYGSTHVRFLGWCSAETALVHMAAADAIAVPSVWEEPCATSVLEGLALSKPTYALARGGTPELKAYEVYPGQLRLFDSMESLVPGLLSVSTVSSVHASCIRPFRRGAEEAVEELLAIYRAGPPVSRSLVQ